MYYAHCSPLSLHYGLLKWSDRIQDLETGELPPDLDTVPPLPPTAPLLNGWSCCRIPAQRWCIRSDAALKIAPIQSGHAVCYLFLHPCPIPPSPVPASLCCWDFYVNRSSFLLSFSLFVRSHQPQLEGWRWRTDIFSYVLYFLQKGSSI